MIIRALAGLFILLVVCAILIGPRAAERTAPAYCGEGEPTRLEVEYVRIIGEQREEIARLRLELDRAALRKEKP